jgi:hypothetical protein
MGKFVILPSHPSNDFFAQFPNCLAYSSKEEFVGNLYYAITHSPEPLADEYSHALSWEAATQRLEAAGCIPTEESELMADALASDDAGIEIPVPSIVEDGQGRKALASTLRYSRLRYRQFRTRLSSEIQQNKGSFYWHKRSFHKSCFSLTCPIPLVRTVLPKALRERLVQELDKRLDLDLDEILESPKLRLKLSPGELDKSLLELYDKLSESPSGDLLRMIGGGGRIGMQNLYMKQRSLQQQRRRGEIPELFPSFLEEMLPEDAEKSPTQRVRWALRRNLPKGALSGATKKKEKAKAATGSSNKQIPKTSLFRLPSAEVANPLFSTPAGSFTTPKSLTRTVSLLI